MAAFEVIALDTATPQLRAPGAADTYTHPRQSLFLAGTAAAPGIAGNSDDNTGMLWPAADNLAWATGGTEQMRLTSTGLGIGTSSPASKLEVAGQTVVKFANPDVSGIVLQATTGTNAAGMKFTNTGGNGFVGLDSSTGTRIGGAAYSLSIWHENAYPITFGTNNTLRATLDSSGNLGLGVTPSAWSVIGPVLQIKQASLVSESFDQLYLSANSFFDGSWKYMQSDIATQYYQAAGQHVWRTAPSGTAGNAISFSQVMTLDASGNLGVGSTAPAGYANYKGITAQGTSGGFLNLRDGTATNQVECAVTPTDGYVKTVNAIPLFFGTNNTERARIPAAGGMVVGTAALATNATDGFLYVPTCAGTPTGTPTTQTGTAPIVINTTNNKLYFYSGGAWRDAGP